LWLLEHATVVDNESTAFYPLLRIDSGDLIKKA